MQKLSTPDVYSRTSILNSESGGVRSAFKEFLFPMFGPSFFSNACSGQVDDRVNPSKAFGSQVLGVDIPGVRKGSFPFSLTVRGVRRYILLQENLS